MERLAAGRWWIAKVTSYARKYRLFRRHRQPTQSDESDELHHKAHATCFIANSVKTRVEIEPPRDT